MKPTSLFLTAFCLASTPSLIAESFHSGPTFFSQRLNGLPMKTEVIAGKAHLFIVAGGFSTKNRPGRISPWFVFTEEN